MSKLFMATTLLFITLFGLYTTSIWPVSINSTFLEHQVTQLTGMLTLGYLSIVMLLSIKPKWLISRFFKVGDMYKAHKELGIASCFSLVLHWLLANDVTLSSWLFDGWMQDFGEDLGEVVLYLLLPFVALSLSRLFKLRWFKKVHHVGGIIFVVAATHSILLLESGSNQFLFSSSVLVFSLIGIVCAYITLSKHTKPLVRALRQKGEEMIKHLANADWKVFHLLRLFPTKIK
ncbi:ferric reductase-like transmembrane domain-containing protein [Vibrio lamellibrachiae]|uniref:ferric reductase-like transmembrane domain-containing protein n=1 Tax=Vibrio lamellibrachiae TaxID=2910253 RepID=UPI003D125D2E